MRDFLSDLPDLERSAFRIELDSLPQVAPRVDNEHARHWYMNESAIQNWSSRALERQINTLYYERLLTSRDRPAVEHEAATHPPEHEGTPT